MANITYCAFCGEEMKYDSESFVIGKTGEPVCSNCRAEEEKVKVKKDG